jgi:hypothetical protein
MPSTRSLAYLATIVLVAGCSTKAGPSGAEPSAVAPSEAPTTHTAPSPEPTSAVRPPRAGDAWLIVSTQDDPTLQVTLDGTLETAYQLPVGVPDATWGHILVATPGERTTRVEDLVVQPGFGGPSQEIDGRWRLPTIGLDPVPVGVSRDRSTVVLVEADAAHGAAGATRAVSRFAVLDGSLAGTSPRIIELTGAFDYDALSPDGSLLFVAQQVRGPLEGRYQVRAVETATGTLRDGIVVDKRNIDEQMAGWPVDQERRPDGMVMTLYRGTEYPFVHALSSVDAWALCIDLPTRGFDDVDAAADWGIVSLGKGEDDLAVNATLGIAVEISASDLSIRRSVDFEPSASTGVRLAKFGHGELGAAGRRVIALPDGSGAIAAGSGGAVLIGAKGLDVRQSYLPGIAVDGMALTPDGKTLFALTRGDGRIARVDVRTGKLDGWVGVGGYDRLLGALPW